MQTTADSSRARLPTAQDLCVAWQHIIAQSSFPSTCVTAMLPYESPALQPQQLCMFGPNPKFMTADKFFSSSRYDRAQKATFSSMCQRHLNPYYWVPPPLSPAQSGFGHSCCPVSNSQIGTGIRSTLASSHNTDILPYFMFLRCLQSAATQQQPINSESNAPASESDVLENQPYLHNQSIKLSDKYFTVTSGPPSGYIPCHPKKSSDIVTYLKQGASQQVEAYQRFLHYLHARSLFEGCNRTGVKAQVNSGPQNREHCDALRRNNKQRLKGLYERKFNENQEFLSNLQRESGCHDPTTSKVRSEALNFTNDQHLPLGQVNEKINLNFGWPLTASQPNNHPIPVTSALEVNSNVSNPSGPSVILSTGELTPIAKLAPTDFVNAAIDRYTQQIVNSPISDKGWATSEMCWSKLIQVRLFSQKPLAEGLSAVFRLTFSMPSKRHRLAIGCSERNRQQNMARILWPQFGQKSFKIYRKLTIDLPSGQPLYVYRSGWSSLDPVTTWKHQELRTRQLTVDDICLVLVQSIKAEQSDSSKSIPNDGKISVKRKFKMSEAYTHQKSLGQQIAENINNSGYQDSCIFEKQSHPDTEYLDNVGCFKTASESGIKTPDDDTYLRKKQMRHNHWNDISHSSTDNPTVHRTNGEDSRSDESRPGRPTVAKWQAFSATHLAQSFCSP